MSEDSFKIDLRVRQCETKREATKNGYKSYFRNNIIDHDGSIIYGEWQLAGIATYPDPEKSTLQKILAMMKKVMGL